MPAPGKHGKLHLVHKRSCLIQYSFTQKFIINYTRKCIHFDFNVDSTSFHSIQITNIKGPGNVAGFNALKNCVAGNGGGDP